MIGTGLNIWPHSCLSLTSWISLLIFKREYNNYNEMDMQEYCKPVPYEYIAGSI